MERNLRIFVLICTIDDGLRGVPSVLLPEEEGVHYVVSWQRRVGDSATKSPSAIDGMEQAGGDGRDGEGGGVAAAEKLLGERMDVTLTTLEGRGLCRNRNHAMQTAVGLLDDPLEDVLFVVADDDERFLPGAFARVREYFIRYSRLDVALFRVRDRLSSDYLKRYPPQALRYAARPRWYYPSSVEMVFRSRLWHAGVRFDERFGLGSARLSAGEEEVFLADASAKGLNVWVLPADLCSTDAGTTGRSALDVKALRSKGAVYGRLLPRWRAFFRSLREAASLGLRHHRSPIPIFRTLWYGFTYIRS